MFVDIGTRHVKVYGFPFVVNFKPIPRPANKLKGMGVLGCEFQCWQIPGRAEEITKLIVNVTALSE